MPPRIRTVKVAFYVLVRPLAQFMPSLFDRSNIAKQKFSVGVNVVSVGSPSRMRMVLLISFGITTLPRSSILRTIPVAFIYIKSPYFSDLHS